MQKKFFLIKQIVHLILNTSVESIETPVMCKIEYKTTDDKKEMDSILAS